jgi:hypothetical protein
MFDSKKFDAFTQPTSKAIHIKTNNADKDAERD